MGASQQDFYLKLDGITGESKDANHKGWIDVLGWEYDVKQSSSMHSGGGGGVGKAKFGHLIATHYVDRSSPNLLKYSGSGKHFPTAILSCCRAGGGQQEYMRITLSECMIAGVTIDARRDDPTTAEHIAIAYGDIRVEVREQNPDGSMGATVTGTWNVKENRE